MLDENTALLWVMENPETRRVTGVMVTDRAFAVGNGWVGQIGKMTWKAHSLAHTRGWQETLARMTELRENAGYVMTLPPQEVPISLSHHRDIERARARSIESASLGFTISNRLATRAA